MARIRNTKPDFYTHELLNDLQSQHPELNPMLVFSGLWTQCEYSGVFLWSVRKLKLAILPFVNFDLEKSLRLLEKHGFIRRYQNGGRDYGHVVNFTKYQAISGSEKSKGLTYPLPDNGNSVFPGTKNDGLMTEPGTKNDGLMTADLGLRTNDIGQMTNDIPASSEADFFQKRFEQTENPSGKEAGDTSNSPEMESALSLAETILIEHRREFPDYLAGKDGQVIQRWAADIEKLIRIDKKAPENIRDVILWVKRPGNFWFHNIESGVKLRKHFERLSGQMKTEKSGPAPPQRNRWDRGFDISQPKEVI